MSRLKKLGWIALAIPTFYMPLGVIELLAGIVARLILGEAWEPTEWQRTLLMSSVYVTLGVSPFYLFWAAFSKRLSLKYKLLWIVFFCVGNMIAMPVFYCHMKWRWLRSCKEREPKPKELAAAGCRLERLGLTRSALTDAQWDIVVRSTRKHRQLKYASIYLLVMAVVFGMMSPWAFQKSYELVRFMITAQRTLVVSKAGGECEVLEPSSEVKDVMTRTVVLMVGLSLYFPVMAIFWAAIGIGRLFVNPNKTLDEFLRTLGAGKTERRE